MEKVVITGGSGMLGRALLARLADTTELVVISRSEKMQLPLRAQYPSVSFVLGDICDPLTLARAFEGAETIIHAAALKHVPISEQQPTEYTRINVGGTMNVIKAAQTVGAKVVGISTDKACQPYNVYGLTKLLMERMLVEHGHRAVRYGNVFGSDGSVISRWDEQLAKEHWIHVTDPHMTRFFFPIEQAVDAVLWTIEHATPGSVVIPRLGAVHLIDLAEAFLVARSGERPRKDTIHVVGRRPGEKAHEQILSAEEGAYTTQHPDDYFILSRTAWVESPQRAITSNHMKVDRISQETLLAWLAR